LRVEGRKEKPTNNNGATAFVDLHTHSTASDGSVAPSDVITAARRAGLTAIALTDHDTVAGIPDARAAAEEHGIEVVAGVELSAVAHGQEIHILGLHLASLDTLEPALLDFRAARHVRADAMVQALSAIGIPLTLDAVLAQANGAAVGRPHVARALIAGGWVRDLHDAFDRYIGAGRPAYVPKPRLAVDEAVALVHAAGGIAVWAHPGRDGILDRIRSFVAQGLDGVEVRHPGHSAEDIARLGAIADALGLVPSGGSDWHGAREGPRLLGCMSVPAEWNDRQAARAQKHRAGVAA
jgi:predicted metal-dependent phosphoesterase TrpH